MKQFLCLLITLSAVIVQGKAAPMTREFTSVKTSVSNLPEEQYFIAEILTERIGERTRLSSQGKTLKISFRIDPSLEEDEAVVDIHKGKAMIRGGRFRSVVAGTGKLLRAIRYGEKSFSLQDGQLVFHPVNPFRQVYFGRHFDNWYHRAPASEIVRYIDDLALWGINAVHTMIAYPEVDADHATPQDISTFTETSYKIIDRVHALDLILTVTGGANTAPANMPEEYRAALNVNLRRGRNTYNVCPEKPGATDYLLSLRRKAVAQFAHCALDGFVYWPYDEGGCSCEKCHPWGGRGYVKLIEQYRQIHEKAYPNCKHLVSTWLFDDDDWKLFYQFLEQQDWVDYLIVDSHDDFPRYPLEHPVPKNVKIITFPEISMWGRRPWGGFGAIAMPARFERLYRQAQRVVSGFQLYSEGIYEDLNKIVVTGLYIAPACHADDVLEDYARYELPGCDVETFKQFIHLLEATHVTREKGTHHARMERYLKGVEADTLAHQAQLAGQALQLALQLNQQILPSMRHCWRWRTLYLRAVIDNEIFHARNVHTPVADEAYRELIKIYHAEEQQRGMAKGYGGHTSPPLMPEFRK